MKIYTLYLAPDREPEPFTIDTGTGVLIRVELDGDRDGDVLDPTGRTIGNVNRNPPVIDLLNGAGGNKG